MAPTITHDEGEEVLPRMCRRRAPLGSPSRTVSGAAQQEAEPSSPRVKRKRSRAAKKQSKKRKRARAADKSREEEEIAASRTEKRNTGDQEEVAAAPASATTEQAASSASEASSAVSSPLRWPYLLPTVIGPGNEIAIPADRATQTAYQTLQSKCNEKLARLQKLPTLDDKVPCSCLVNAQLLHVRDDATRTVLQAAKAVFGLSSYLDGKLLSRTSGFLIDYKEEAKSCTVLTSAVLLRLKSSTMGEWSLGDEYAPDAEVRIHLLDENETAVVAHLVFFDKHFNLAIFKVEVEICAQIPCFSSEVVCGQEAFVIGRDEGLYLKAAHGNVQYRGPGMFHRHHYMFINCGIVQCGTGGPVIDFNGNVLGMSSTPRAGFIPSSIILKWLHMWKKFHCVPRVHVGMTFQAIKFLDPACVEMISRKCKLDAGLIVTEVSEGSVAEKLGVRIGDVIVCFNGEDITTTVELENLLMRICEEHLDKGRDIGSNVDIPVDVFHVRKGSRSTINLKVHVSDTVEVVMRGSYLVSASNCA